VEWVRALAWVLGLAVESAWGLAVESAWGLAVESASV
jgi:hypothetical protein